MFYIDNFLIYLKDLRYSKKTIKEYGRLLQKFENYFESKGITEVQIVNEKDVSVYLRQLQQRKVSGKEYSIEIARLKKYFHYLEENRFIFLSPLRDYTNPKYPKHSFPTLSETEIENILQGIKTDHPLCVKGKAILELAYSSALRPRELYNLKITDIDFKKGLIFIEQSKNNKDRIVPVGKTALFWIEKYITEVKPRYIHNKTHNYLFISHKTGEKLTVYGIRWAILETLRLSDFTPIKPYSLRSTAATALLLNGMSITYISKLLGHSDIRTTQIYLHIKTIQLQKELSTKHPRLKLKR